MPSPVSELSHPDMPDDRRASYWLIALAFSALGLPTLISVGMGYWSTAEGSQGPLVFATAIWLLWRSRHALVSAAVPLKTLAVMPALGLVVLLYAFGRAYSSLPIQTFTLYIVGLLLSLIYLGRQALRRFWFPFVYPIFLIVPPPSVVVALTQSLRIWLSTCSVSILHFAGYPVAFAGATIQVAQFELLVRTACAGLGSMYTLCAVGLFYIHLRREPRLLFALALTAFVIPVAILANLLRVIMLILMTWYFGSIVSEGVAHQVAGLMMFCIAMLGMFCAEIGLRGLMARNGGSSDA